MKSLLFLSLLICTTPIFSQTNWFVESQNKVYFYKVPSGDPIKPERSTAKLFPTLLFGSSSPLGQNGFGIGTFAIVGQGFGKGYILPSWSQKTGNWFIKASLGTGFQTDLKNYFSFKSYLFCKKGDNGPQAFFTWEQGTSAWKNYFYQGYVETGFLPEANYEGYARVGIHAQYNTLVGPRMSVQMGKYLTFWQACGPNIESGGWGWLVALKLSM